MKAVACPKCHLKRNKSLRILALPDGTARRRRKCLECGHRFNTREHIERKSLEVALRAQSSH